MIYATGDTHGNFQRFTPEHFPEQAQMTRDDFMIVCGDFGGVWEGGKKMPAAWTGWKTCRLPLCLSAETTKTSICSENTP